MLRKKDLVTIADLEVSEIKEILNLSVSMKEVLLRKVKKLPVLRGKTVVLLFYEPSTRTRVSFELAAKRLSADVIAIEAQSSSIVKGEGLIDTMKTFTALRADAIVMRHSLSGSAQLAAQNTNVSVVNAGDGKHAHPTQALLDAFSMIEKLGDLKGKKVLIVGDISHSRVAHSNISVLNKLGAQVFVSAPPVFIPKDIEKLNVSVQCNLDKIIPDMDVINVLRIQKERQKQGVIPSIKEYSKFYQINAKRLSTAKSNVLIMHPGPMNRGVEISSEVADSEKSIIETQVTNGIAVRMAIFYLLLGRKK